MSEIVMPRLSDSMEEGTILKWLKADGDSVARGEPLAEIETDKATLTYEADAAGILRIVVAAGETLPIGEVIATLDDGDGSSSDDGGGGAETAAAEAEGSAPEAEPPAAQAPPAAAEPAPGPAVAAAPGPSAPAGAADGAPAPSAGGRVKASPLARRMAREQGVDLNAVTGSGPGGRVVKADIEQAARNGVAPLPAGAVSEPATAPAEAPAPAGQAAAPAATGGDPAPATAPPAGETATAKGDVTIQELTRVQQVIARRMAESKATVPEFTLRTEVDMEGCVALRSELKQLGTPFGAEAGDVPSYNDMVVKASALALREFPRANGSYRDARFELHSRVNVGVAVAATDALVVPTIFDADRKPLREIARESRALAERVRAGTVTPPELSGGTFTVSNLGMYGVSDFTAVINPPQAAILAVGELAPRAVVRNTPSGAQGTPFGAQSTPFGAQGTPFGAQGTPFGAQGGELVARHVMGVTLTCDHRILYGADAAQFLARIRALLEQPLALAF